MVIVVSFIAWFTCSSWVIVFCLWFVNLVFVGEYVGSLISDVFVDWLLWLLMVACWLDSFGYVTLGGLVVCLFLRLLAV